MNCEQDISQIEDLKEVSKVLVKKLIAPQIICLRGHLGSGKTQTVRYMAEGLGVNPKEIHSPSFSLINIYEGKNHTVYHVDFFRLENLKYLDSTGF